MRTIIIILVLGLVGGSLTARTPASKLGDDFLGILLEKWPGELHPAKTMTLEGVMISNQVYDTLVRLGAGSQIIPNLAESWSYDEKSQRIRLKLRGDVRLSNGTHLMSQHIRKTFEAIVSSKAFRNLDKISGAKAFRDGKAKDIRGFIIHNDREFSIQFDFFYPKFLEELADPYAAVYVEFRNAKWPLGTGPYRIEGVDVTSNRVILDKNPFYERTNVTFEHVILTTEPIPEIDISFVAPPLGLAKALSRTTEYFDTEVYFIALNATHSNLKDLNTRATLVSYLTPTMTDEILGPVKYAIGGFIPLGVPGHNPKLRPPEPQRRTKPKEKVEVWNYLPKLKPLADRYCQELKRNQLGCEVKVQPLDTFSHDSKKGQLFFARQKSTSYSPEYLMSCFTSNNYSNMFTHGDPEHDPLTRLMDSLFDRIQEVPSSHAEELLKRYQDMDSKVLELALVKPFRYGANKSVWFRPRVTLPRLDTLGPFNFRFSEVRKNVSR